MGGWGQRTATLPGAYGNYAWKDERREEESWSYSSVAPSPDKPPTGMAGGSFRRHDEPTCGVSGATYGGRSPAFGASGPVYGLPVAMDGMHMSSGMPFGIPVGSSCSVGGPSSTTKALPSLLPDDPCPKDFSSGRRNMDLNELVAQGIVMREYSSTSTTNAM